MSFFYAKVVYLKINLKIKKITKNILIRFLYLKIKFKNFIKI